MTQPLATFRWYSGTSYLVEFWRDVSLRVGSIARQWKSRHYNSGRLVPASHCGWFWSVDLLQGMGANVEPPTQLGERPRKRHLPGSVVLGYLALIPEAEITVPCHR